MLLTTRTCKLAPIVIIEVVGRTGVVGVAFSIANTIPIIALPRVLMRPNINASRQLNPINIRKDKQIVPLIHFELEISALVLKFRRGIITKY